MGGTWECIGVILLDFVGCDKSKEDYKIRGYRVCGYLVDCVQDVFVEEYQVLRVFRASQEEQTESYSRRSGVLGLLQLEG